MTQILLAIDWSFLDKHIGGEKVSNYLWFIGIVLTTLLLKKPVAIVLTRIGSGIVRRFTFGRGKHLPLFRSLLRKPIELLLQSVFFYVAANQLNILLDHSILKRHKDKTDELIIRLGDLVDHLFLLFIIIFITHTISRVIDFVYRVQLDKARVQKNRDRIQILPLIKEMLKLLVWVMCFFWILGIIFHVNIPALITGLGIGGVAIALAAKESVENLFASFTILLDKPFQAGDSVKTGQHEGVVERIGFRSTRLRNPDGAAYIIPNKKLIDDNLENLSRREMRRVQLIMNLRYSIYPHQILQQMMAELKDSLTNLLQTKEPVDVTIETFGENSFQLVVTYHLPHPLPDGKTLPQIKEEVNIYAYEILSRYRRMGVQ
jgi:MscS family membrane protein